MGHPVWPLYDLRLRTPDLELRLPTEDELAGLGALARAGVHEPDQMPFLVPWTRKPSPAFEREFMQFHWGARAGWSARRWLLCLAVFRNGTPIGLQDLGADEFAVLREVRTGSWLGIAHQGHGYGKQMRAAVLHLAFAELGAVAAHSSAFAGNPASIGVSRSLGYQPNGVGRRAPLGEPVEHLMFRLSRERWQAYRHCEVKVSGLDSCRDMFGV